VAEWFKAPVLKLCVGCIVQSPLAPSCAVSAEFWTTAPKTGPSPYRHVLGGPVAIPVAEMKLTKIDVAEAHLVSAVRLLFQEGYPASVYLLAASAREILTTIGEKTGVQTVLRSVADTMGKPLKELIGAANEHANFLKHADRDPTATLETLTDADVEMLLFVAAHDFYRIAKGQPIEAQVFEAWHLARHWKRVSDAPLKMQPVIRASLRHFHGIKSMEHPDQLRFGWAKLQEALTNPTLKMDIQREVLIPEEGEG
jgi:hypothetical protein